MERIPVWLKWLGAVLVFAALYGAARLLILLDQGVVGKDGAG